MKDVKDGTELLKISDNVYRNEKNGKKYIYCTEQVLEEDNFNSELRKIYQERAVRTSNEDIYIVVDGKLLEDPSCGGPIEKVGINEYRGRYSKNSFMMINDLLMAMKESVSGSEVKLKDDGRYYSEALGKFFTLEKVKDGSFKFIPTFLPYEGMLDVPAKIVDDKLVGENGISFPVEETGYVVTPSKQNLATQEDIDKCIKRDREITEKTLNLLKKDIDINLRARTIAWQIEIAKLKRKGIIDAARKENRTIYDLELPEIPEIPDDIPSDLMKMEMESVKNHIAELNKIQEEARTATLETSKDNANLFLGIDNLNEAIKKSVTGIDILQAGRDLNESTKRAITFQEKNETSKEPGVIE